MPRQWPAASDQHPIIANIILDEVLRRKPPQEIVKTTLPTNIPTQEETESSNATTWIIVLLVLGSIIPMATWWVFSR